MLFSLLAIAAGQKTEEELAKELETLKQENEKLCGAAWQGMKGEGFCVIFLPLFWC
jgi:hypothetical protein